MDDCYQVVIAGRAAAERQRNRQIESVKAIFESELMQVCAPRDIDVVDTTC